MVAGTELVLICHGGVGKEGGCWLKTLLTVLINDSACREEAKDEP